MHYLVACLNVRYIIFLHYIYIYTVCFFLPRIFSATFGRALHEEKMQNLYIIQNLYMIIY